MSEAVRVPLLDLVAQYREIQDEIDAAVKRVIESQRFILGPEVQALEEEIAEYCGVRHAIGCASGSDAILLSLLALDLAPADQVIVPTYTFFATAGSVVRAGAVPVFADVDPETYGLTPETIRAAAKRSTNLKAIIAVHLFGQVTPMEGILTCARELGVPVIEDAAQAIGARDAAGHAAGATGVAGCLSFFPSKNLGGFGDGGMIISNDDTLADRVRILGVHGSRPKYYHALVGINSRLDALQAAVLRVKLPRLPAWSRARAANARAYQDRFSKEGAGLGVGSFSDLELPLRVPKEVESPAVHIFNQYVVRVPAERRDGLRAFLGERGIGSEVYYPIPLHQQECFSHLSPADQRLPVADLAARETLALPVFPELSTLQIETVVETVAEFLRSS
jgi:dTDP-4-amino-4,6-dideoxygalactose transaminase